MKALAQHTWQSSQQRGISVRNKLTAPGVWEQRIPETSVPSKLSHQRRHRCFPGYPYTLCPGCTALHPLNRDAAIQVTASRSNGIVAARIGAVSKNCCGACITTLLMSILPEWVGQDGDIDSDGWLHPVHGFHKPYRNPQTKFSVATLNAQTMNMYDRYIIIKT